VGTARLQGLLQESSSARFGSSAAPVGKVLVRICIRARLHRRLGRKSVGHWPLATGHCPHTSDSASTSTTRLVRGILFSVACSIIARKTPFIRSRLADFSRK